ncbi:nitrate- and nitrite sensing domain-containing protein [Poseidonibacter lekithochrous]|uniref:nitrate- and nitrite sensing domain-containing protein n=1 Tax=Poseidonibacter lekithochrous TaxID=1904463 RepID=UPI000D3719EA|nr:nitrate- and nitrite sensing domain-containing protein [Poseidonibacter lekithochrous]
MSLQSKLIAIASLSIIIICFLGIKIVEDSYDNYKRALSIEEMIDLSDDISHLVHEMQKERGLSAAFIISGADVFRERLVNQRVKTTKLFKEFEHVFYKNIDSYDNEIKERIKKILSMYKDNIDLKRMLIINESIDVFEVIDFFTKINDEFLSNLLYLSKISNNPEITNDLIAFNNLLLLKDRLGLERAIGSIVLVWNFSDESIFRFKEVATSIEIYKDNFYFYLSLENRQYFKEKIQSSKLAYVDELIEKFINWNGRDNIDIRPMHWFDSTTKKINFYQEQNLFFIKQLKKDVFNYKNKSKSELILLSIIMISSILIFTIFTYLTQKRILKSLHNFKIGLLSFFDYLNQKSEKIKVLNESTNDEFASMSKIVNKNIETTKKNLDEDKAVLNEAIVIIKEFEKGNLHQRLTSEISNPILNELKNILNQMANNLELTIEELQHTNEEYEVSLDNLKKTQTQLIESEKMASLGGLVAGVAHEINTPVGIGITGSSHFLEMTDKLKKLYDSDNMGEDDFEDYLNSSVDLAKLINLNLSKAAELVKSFKQIAVDQTSEEKRTFALEKYLNELLLSIGNVLKRTELEVDIQCDSNIKIYSYPGLLSQIITNLIMNSIIHGYDEIKQGKIIIDIKVIDENLVISYKDDGKGIPSENLLKIFDPFFTTNRENGGSGLGLNIIYNIITKQLNGTIKCKSNEPVGTEFLITFKI